MVHKLVVKKIKKGSSVADKDPGSGAFLTPGSGFRDPGWVKSQNPDPAEQPGSYFRDLRNHFFRVTILQFFDADPGSWMEKFGSGIREAKNSDP